MLRQDISTRHIPVVAVSANAVQLEIVNALPAGFFRSLTKPFSSTDLWR
jgi:protein-histidine pros-kinase